MGHIKPDWIAVDWGTSNLRAWAMASDGGILAEATSPKGMGQLSPCAFEPTLLTLIDHWLPEDHVTPVIACGMVGARQGWIDAGYEWVPGPAHAANPLTIAPTQDPRLSVYIIHGLKQVDPADVMRGEETQIAGLLAQHPNYDGLVCLPGTHSKWATLTAGQVSTFTTFLTGEMFDVLATHSVLKYSVQTEDWDDAAFAQAVQEARQAPAQVLARLFSVRATGLVGEQSPAAARATLSGLLIGAELAALPHDLSNTPVALIGQSSLAKAYTVALTQAGARVTPFESTALTLAGLRQAYGRLQS